MGNQAFHVAGDAYDRFMGRYSRPLAEELLAFVPLESGRALDVGCGPGALTEPLAVRLGAENVVAVDPSPGFVETVAARIPGLDARVAPAESLPFADDAFDAAFAQLVVHFMDDAPAGVAEMRRVVRPGGIVAAAMWAAGGGMTMLDAFWTAATEVAGAPGRELMRYGGPGELGELLRGAGVADVVEADVDVAASYGGFEDFWEPFTLGVGPAGAFCATLEPERQRLLRDALHERIGAPDGAFTLPARARVAYGRA